MLNILENWLLEQVGPAIRLRMAILQILII